MGAINQDVIAELRVGWRGCQKNWLAHGSMWDVVEMSQIGCVPQQELPTDLRIEGDWRKLIACTDRPGLCDIPMVGLVRIGSVGIDFAIAKHLIEPMLDTGYAVGGNPQLLPDCAEKGQFVWAIGVATADGFGALTPLPQLLGCVFHLGLPLVQPKAHEDGTLPATTDWQIGHNLVGFTFGKRNEANLALDAIAPRLATKPSNFSEVVDPITIAGGLATLLAECLHVVPPASLGQCPATPHTRE
jgi:hypothetical protein